MAGKINADINNGTLSFDAATAQKCGRSVSGVISLGTGFVLHDNKVYESYSATALDTSNVTGTGVAPSDVIITSCLYELNGSLYRVITGINARIETNTAFAAGTKINVRITPDFEESYYFDIVKAFSETDYRVPTFSTPYKNGKTYLDLTIKIVDADAVAGESIAVTII